MRQSFRHLPRLLPYVRPHGRMLSLSALLMLLGVAGSLAAPWPLALLVDSALGSRPVPGWLPVHSTGVLVTVAVLAGIVLTLLSSGLDVVDNYVNTRIAQRMTLAFRSQLFAHALRLPLSYHDRRRQGGLMNTINSQAGCAGEITVALLPLVQNALTVVGMLVVALRLNPVLALLSLTVVPFVTQSTGWYGRHIEPRLRSVRDMESESLSIVFEAMSMVRVIISFGRERHEHRRFMAQGERATEARVRLTVQQTLFSLGLNLITALGTALVLWFGAHLVLRQELTVGELLVVMAYVAAVYRPLTAISGTIADLQQQLISLEAALALADAAVEVDDRPGARALGRARGAVVFEGVSFDYPGRTGTLSDVSFSVAPGEVVAVVGPTGAGKSTLVSLLPRFGDPREGRVLLDGHDLRDLTLGSLRAQLSIVLQEPLLFSGSIRDNIRYGCLDATDAQVEAAARAANCHDFVSRLPQGYDSLLGERGSLLSGGERQRIAIARAFLRDAPLLILDEPTSSVDSRTEKVILEALERLMTGRTTFMIAHRLSTVRTATTILVVDEGRVVEQGDHDTLLAAEGLYAEMVAAQTARPTTVVEVAAGAPAEVAELVEVALPEPVVAAPAVAGRPVVVVLGMLTKMPVAGVAWQTLHYLAGFERLGYETYYVEAHGRTPSMLMETEHDDGPAKAAAYLDRLLSRFGFAGRWAYQQVHGDDRVLGMSPAQLASVLSRAAVVVNLHGGTEPLPEHAATGRLVYLETDPVQLQVELHDGLQSTRDFLDPHVAFFSFGEALGRPECGLPATPGYDFLPTRQPVVMDFWSRCGDPVEGRPFTTVGNWQQAWREVVLDGETYTWSKHSEFATLLDLPARVPGAPLELALASCPEPDREALRARGFRVRDALSISREVDPYRSYLAGSTAELTAAKDQNVRLRTGWFSDRSATYLASGRAVVTQDTGFGLVLPTGSGLHAWSTLDEAVAAVEAVRADPVGQGRAARALAREHFAAEVVLGRLLTDLGLPARVGGVGSAPSALPPGTVLTPVSRRPLVLPPATVQTALTAPYPAPAAGVDHAVAPEVSVVVVTHGGLALTRLCLLSLLGDPDAPRLEVVVVDNASTDGTPAHVADLASADPRVRLLRSGDNTGFAAGVNRGLAAARGDVLVVLNNDTVLPPGALRRLVGHLADPEVGAVGPVTNRCGNEAEVAVSYRTVDELAAEADRRAVELAGQVFDNPVLTLFCAAFRRDVLDRVGGLDERFGLGYFEDDDWAERVHRVGLRLVVAEDVLVHHHAEGSFGALVASGARGELFLANQAAFEQKWGVVWEAHGHRQSAAYLAQTRRACELVRELVPADAHVLVVSKGDRALLRLGPRTAGHFPQGPDGGYAGHYPPDSSAAVDELERLCDAGATHLVLPAAGAWWLEHYDGLAQHLDGTALLLADDPACRVYRLRAHADVREDAR